MKFGKTKLWQAVEVYPNGDRVRRVTGSFRYCAYVAGQMVQCGFKVLVEPYTDD